MKLDKKLAILLLINLILWIPSLFEPISYGDECIYLTLGNAFRKGLTFYRDIHDNKPPLLYLTAAIANGRLSWFRAIAIICNLVHLGIIYQLIKRITKNRIAPLAGGIVFTLLYLIFEGRTANGEMFMIMPASLAVYLLFQYPQKKTFLFGGLIGFLFSIGFLFKIPILFDLVGILFALYIISMKKLQFKSLIRILRNKRFWGIIAGFFSPILLTIFYYSLKGAFTPYVRSALLQNIGYLSSWQGSNLGLFVRFSLLIIFSFMFFIFRKKIPSNLSFFGIWFIWGLFGALLSERPYPHYLIEIAPSLAILIALTIDKKTVFNFVLTSSAIGILLASYLYFNFWWYPILPYYRNFVSYAAGKINKKQYLNYWGEKTASDYKLARFIKWHSPENNRVFVWGDGACIYAISKRLPPGRYTVNYHIYDFNGFQETLEAIKKTKPKIIIKLKDEKRIWPELDQHLSKNYHSFSIQDISDSIYLLNQTYE